MEIAIIGSGNVGKALGGSFTRAGHSVTISAAHPEHAQQAAQTVGARAAASAEQAVSGADLVILAVPATALDDVAHDIAKAATGKVVVEVSNRPTPDADGPGTSVAE